MTTSLLEIGAVLMSDAENLITRVKNGDDAAFRLIFERHHRLVLRFLYGMVGEPDFAEELAQETFVRAYTNINTLKDETKLSTWLCGIAKNVAYNALRARRKVAGTIEINKDSAAEIKSEEILPDSRLLNSELNSVIRNALSRLDEDKRTVFTLKMMQQLSYEEIAEITGFSIPKLKTDLHRAKAEMRRLIRPYLETSNEL
jgi:RNA polymerase sigma-70 factor, ECF subfamily